MNFYVISYDIPDDKRRKKIADILENHASRVQYSVFEANLNEDEMQQVQEELRRVANLEEDNLRFYRLCQNCLDTTEVWGNTKITVDPDYYLV